MQIASELAIRLDEVLDSRDLTFTELVRLSGLDPIFDFVDADLRGTDLRDIDLSEFDFTRADLRNAIWSENTKTPSGYRYALRGHGSDPIQAIDFEDIVLLVKKSRTWSERFLAYAIIIDNFGLTYLTLDLLREVTEGDASEYMKDCCVCYFLCTFVKNFEMMTYCKYMASQSNARVNMFRISKVRRVALEVSDYLNDSDLLSNVPGGLAAREVSRTIHLL